MCRENDGFNVTKHGHHTIWEFPIRRIGVGVVVYNGEGTRDFLGRANA